MNSYKLATVIPNWNGLDTIGKSLDSLRLQSVKSVTIVVDNGSIDGSLEYIQKEFPEVILIKHEKNLGFAGGVNAGIKKAIELGMDFVALLNNDAVAHKDWLKHLVTAFDNKVTGIATCKLMSSDRDHLDSTGDMYTTWGLPYPRGRGEPVSDKYDTQTDIFAASGGASMYRVKMLDQIGLFDEDFFAYYEDVDISFRAQLAGWKVRYVPRAEAYHQIGATSGKIKGFTTTQTLKNLPLLLAKNVPRRYLGRVGCRYLIAHVSFFAKALSRGDVLAAVKGDAKGTWLLIKAPQKRRVIQQSKTVTDEYIWSMLVHDLPPNAKRLRKLRDRWRRAFKYS